ncbi:hypothetical protein J6590_086963 [Homalodisca vitripennis]|nr:hypothetical protein J6590_086963 [Homalodisca vitripennis]
MTIREAHLKGGVAIYKHNSFGTEVKSLGIGNNEELVCEMSGIKVSTTNKKQIYILGVYRPPSASVNHTFATLATVLNRIPRDNSGICQIGDLNIDSLDSSRREKLALDDFLASYEITRLKLPPTRISSSSSSSIDVVCTNLDHNSLKVDILCRAL